MKDKPIELVAVTLLHLFTHTLRSGRRRPAIESAVAQWTVCCGVALRTKLRRTDSLCYFWSASALDALSKLYCKLNLDPLSAPSYCIPRHGARAADDVG